MIKKLGTFKRLISHTINYGLGSVLAQVIGFFLIPVYTSYLDPEEYGIIELTVALTAFLIPVMKLGLPGAVTRFYFDFRDNKEKLANYITTLFRMLNLSALSFIIFCAVFFHVAGSYLIPDLPFWPYIFLGIITAGLGANNQLQQKLLQNREQSRYSMILKTSFVFFSIGLTLILVIIFELGALGFVLATFVTTFLFFIQAYIYLRKDLGGTYDKKMASESMKFGLGILPHHLANSFAAFLTRSILSRTASLASVGIYSIGLRFFAPLEIIYSSIVTAFVPIYNDYRVKENDIKIRQTIQQILLLSFVIFSLYLFCTPVIMKLMLPPNYLESIKLVPILALAFIGKTLYQISMVEVFYSKNTKFISLLTISSIFLNIIIFISLLGGYQEEAISWGFSAGFLLGGILALFYKKRVSNYTLFFKELSAFAISSLVIWGIAYQIMY